MHLNPETLNDLSCELAQYILTLKRAPTPTEISKFLKIYMDCKQKGKLLANYATGPS